MSLCLFDCFSVVKFYLRSTSQRNNNTKTNFCMGDPLEILRFLGLSLPSQSIVFFAIEL